MQRLDMPLAIPKKQAEGALKVICIKWRPESADNPDREVVMQMYMKLSEQCRDLPANLGDDDRVIEPGFIEKALKEVLQHITFKQPAAGDELAGIPPKPGHQPASFYYELFYNTFFHLSDRPLTDEDRAGINARVHFKELPSAAVSTNEGEKPPVPAWVAALRKKAAAAQQSQGGR